jgi:2-polyprenyl-3-methyl-5-hydroxy-6-metoxy-1,4-benzoquinol methylase
MSIVSDNYPSIATMLDAQLAVFPRHERFLAGRFAVAGPDELQFLDEIAELIIRIADPSVRAICEDYRWLTQMFAEEEIYFHRNGHYRLSSFADATAQVYDNAPFMRRYMNGLLVTRLWWKNHSELLRVFRDVFLPGNAPGFSHLEVGPGHGFFLYLAARAPGCASVEGWDVSAASVEATRVALARMGSFDGIVVRQSDISAPQEHKFDSISCCEVLEHLEDPAAALRVLVGLLNPGGRLFITSPVNAPAPDHIHLFHNPEELVQMMEDAGLRIQDTCFAPVTGATLERARKQKLTISCAVIAMPESLQ